MHAWHSPGLLCFSLSGWKDNNNAKHVAPLCRVHAALLFIKRFTSLRIWRLENKGIRLVKQNKKIWAIAPAFAMWIPARLIEAYPSSQTPPRVGVGYCSVQLAFDLHSAFSSVSLKTHVIGVVSYTNKTQTSFGIKIPCSYLFYFYFIYEHLAGPLCRALSKGAEKEKCTIDSKIQK